GTGSDNERHHAHDERYRRHEDGAQTQSAGFEHGAHYVHAFLLLVLRELDDQDGVLARKADQHDQSDLGEDVVVAATEPHAADGGEQTHGHDQDYGQRQRPRFVQRSEHEKREQHAQREHEHGGIARQDLLIRELGPLEGH